ncbi:ATP synthase F1 subunit epsilon [Eubacterium sp.]|uniref:ATP synthase F1 subunit epsilon n=1 Tax=Eubacterium sp. TaxID=142586 RepID=UPI00259288CB|nr:ATP synthase F1 subunit epsilon [Eubacterium sp.]MCR5629028.1 ATP synthase F1 subunit epsilon [Eubacterium sp.]
MKTFSLKIVSCNKLFYEGECEIITFPMDDGDRSVLANHEGFIGVIDIGEVRFRVPGEKDYRRVVTSDGVIRVRKNMVDLVVYSAERPEDIDRFRAQAALERAREQLQQKQSIREYHVSRASLSRAMARLKASNYVGGNFK